MRYFDEEDDYDYWDCDEDYEEELAEYCRCGHSLLEHSEWDEQVCDLAFACRCAGFEADEY